MNKYILMFAINSALVLSTNAAFAAKDRTGAEVVKAVCSECHQSGKDGAPKIGDLADWGKRMSQGITTLTGHAVTGYRGMPAHGGSITVTDLELTRAILYMISPKGEAHANLNKSMVNPKLSGKELYSKRCQECHATGKEGAPKVGDSRAWGERMMKGIDGLTESAVMGHNKMPSRGGLTTISDAEIRLAIDYMVSTASSSFAKQQAKSQR
jgi:cytochrome c5